MMGHYLYEDVQMAADLVRFGGGKNGYRSRQTSPDEAVCRIVKGKSTTRLNNRQWSEFYKAMDMAG